MNNIIDLLGPGVLLAAPILYAALGGLFTQRAGIFNIALEGFMLLSAYFSVAVATSTGSLLLGTLAGVAAAGLTAAVMGVLVVSFRADEVIVGIAVNVLALGLTTFLLTNGSGSGTHTARQLSHGYGVAHLTVLDHVPVLDPLLNRRDPLVWALIPAVLLVWWVFSRTSYGLQLKAAGEAPLAARSAGVRVTRVRFTSVVISGAFTGLAGAELAIGSVHLFSENMTNGRGIIAFAAVVFGAGRVGRTTLACLLFGAAQALAGLLQIKSSFPSQFVLMVPFLLTVAAIALGDAARRRGPRAQPPPARPGTAGTAMITVAGHLTIDDIHRPGTQTLPGTIGGAAGYAALGASLTGCAVRVVSRVGADYPVGALHTDRVDCGRVDTVAVLVLPGASIRNVARYTASGDRRFQVADRDRLLQLTPVPDDLTGADLGQQPWVLVAPATLDQQEALVTGLRATGARIALDTELHYLHEPDAAQHLQAITRQVDYFLPSIEHLRHLHGPDAVASPAGLLQVLPGYGCPAVLVKCGINGVLLIEVEPHRATTVPAVPDIDVADPTGAGDGFNGGFLAGLAQGQTTLAAAASGAVAASFVVQSTGVGVPGTFDSVERARRHRTVLAGMTAADPQHRPDALINTDRS